MGVDGSHVDCGARGGQDRGAGDDVFDRGGGETEGSVGGEEGERLDVDGVVRRVGGSWPGLVLLLGVRYLGSLRLPVGV